ncbi:thiamine phosphate synthase [Blastochloris tepida]|uniref:Putative thiamine-phosphate synthase n=1 Tax=Blastochloris tepida TaxID=2233851 RepID=A0A348G0W1_9HYPH|nr:thiamine phosphate synthase [Blastochloris tepida]BBF93194.1 putative thiamine-phosphate synthase [Blastochloris tepida]
MPLPAPPLLLITDRRQAARPLDAVLAAALKAGCRWASLREKDLPDAEQVALALRLKPVARRFGAVLTLHGTPELAKAAGLDGVHLPDGADAAHARAVLGPSALIGVSQHRPGPADRAADYVIAAPVFLTASKPGYGPALGLDGLAAMVAEAGRPVVALGGIASQQVPDCLKAGAAGIAVMGGVMRADDPGAEVAALLASMRCPAGISTERPA